MGFKLKDGKGKTLMEFKCKDCGCDTRSHVDEETKTVMCHKCWLKRNTPPPQQPEQPSIPTPMPETAVPEQPPK